MLALAPTLVGERNLNLKRIFLKGNWIFFGVYFEGVYVAIMSMVGGCPKLEKKKSNVQR